MKSSNCSDKSFDSNGSFDSDRSFDLEVARRRCVDYRRRILEISQTVTALHVAPAFSCLEITDLIYHELMRFKQTDLHNSPELSDTFLMSKGHGCLAQYVILEKLNILSKQDLSLYCKPGGQLGAHPDYGVPGIEASTGSLGHGLGIAVGMAYADKLMRSDRKTYVVLSDGELQEGSTWEAIMMAANLNLNNLIAFLDLNDFGGLARMSEGHPAFYPVVEKLESFGWEVAEVDGHNSQAMFEAVVNFEAGLNRKNEPSTKSSAKNSAEKPFFIVCNTIKGKGVSYMEHVPIWHYRSPNPTEYKQALNELETSL